MFTVEVSYSAIDFFQIVQQILESDASNLEKAELRSSGNIRQMYDL